MLKNVASQTIDLFAFDYSTGAPKAGDAANMVFYVTKDYGTVTAIASNSGVPTEVDATNAKGVYKIALSQAETSADALLFSGKSSTSNVAIVPKTVYTDPANYTKAVIDSAGLIDSNAVKVGPSGAGTAQTAKDLSTIMTSALTESYATDGSNATGTQLLYQIWSFLAEANISGTTIICKKLDGSTTAMTMTISDATNPVTITRAS